MDSGQIFGLVYGILFAGLLLFAWWRLRRRGIGLREAFMGRKYTVEVEGDAQALCKRALLEVAGSRTTRKFKKHKLRAPTHLPGGMPGEAAVEFALEPAGADRTRITLSVYDGGAADGEMNAKEATQRAELGERLAEWLTEHGNGTRVRHT